MKTKFYLNIKENGSIRATKTKVSLDYNEISIEMSLELPNTLFRKPIITGNIKVTEDMVSPNTLEAVVAEEIKNAIESVEGVKIELVMPKED